MKESRLIMFGIVIAFLLAIGIIGAAAIYYSPSESQQGNTQIIIYQDKNTNRQQTQNQDQGSYQSYQQSNQDSQQEQQYQTQQDQQPISQDDQSRSYTTSESQYLSGQGYSRQRYSYSSYRPYYYPRYYKRYYLASPYYYPYFPRYPYFNHPPHYYWNIY